MGLYAVRPGDALLEVHEPCAACNAWCIQQSQKHLLGLINQVLNYTRVETGTVHYNLIDVPVSEALAAAEALVVPQVRAKGLSYLIAGCDRRLRVRADREKLQQILLNLLTNAIKFTDAGEIRVACPARPGIIAITVSDTGVGIATDKLATVFEPFVQVDQRLTRSHEGVGLGLAISRDLARGMGGDLTVESQLGVGSTFTLTLPAASDSLLQLQSTRSPKRLNLREARGHMGRASRTPHDPARVRVQGYARSGGSCRSSVAKCSNIVRPPGPHGQRRSHARRPSETRSSPRSSVAGSTPSAMRMWSGAPKNWPGTTRVPCARAS